MIQAQGHGRRLLMFPAPFQGHISPMLQLATILHSKGFSITIIHTHFNSPNPSNYPNFTFIPISDGLDETQVSPEDFIDLATILNINCVNPFRDCLSRLLSDNNSQDPISCLISDAPLYFTQAITDSFMLPRIVFRTTSFTSFLVYATFPLLRQKGFLPIKASELEKPVPELSTLKVKDLPVLNTRDPENVFRFTASLAKETKASSGIILNSFEDLEESAMAVHGHEFQIPIFTIGPFHKYCTASSSSLLTQDRNCITWLDTQAHKSVIYVSFGSLATINETEFMEMAWGLANSKVPFLWVVRTGSVHGREWVEPLPSGFLEMISGKGCIVKWAPQQEVLAHPAVGGFWTHNGWNSTLESICEGIPMLCWPRFGDQMVNARYVSDVWRVGLQPEKVVERGKIEREIRRLMVDEEGEEVRERVMNLKERVDLSLRRGGSSYESLQKLVNYLLSL